MKINKYGKVVISEDEILVTEFEFDCNNGGTGSDCEKAALLWAIKELAKALRVE